MRIIKKEEKKRGFIQQSTNGKFSKEQPTTDRIMLIHEKTSNKAIGSSCVLRH